MSELTLKNAINALWTTDRLFDVLETLQVDEIKLTYSGGHDSGGVDEISWYFRDETSIPAVDGLTVIDAAIAHRLDQLNAKFAFPAFLLYDGIEDTSQATLTVDGWHNLLDYLFSETLDRVYDGFDNEPVVAGEITWDVSARIVRVEGTETITEYDESGDNDDETDDNVIEHVESVVRLLHGSERNQREETERRLVYDAIQQIAALDYRRDIPDVVSNFYFSGQKQHPFNGMPLQQWQHFVTCALVYADVVEETGLTNFAARIRGYFMSLDLKAPIEALADELTIQGMQIFGHGPVAEIPTAEMIWRKQPFHMSVSQFPALDFGCLDCLPVSLVCDEQVWRVFGEYVCSIFPLHTVEVFTRVDEAEWPLLNRLATEKLSSNGRCIFVNYSSHYRPHRMLGVEAGFYDYYRRD